MASSTLATDPVDRPFHANKAAAFETPGVKAAVTADPVPWFLYAVLFASTCVIVGVIWDISWHRTIGRDTFWTSAHLAIYVGGIVAGLTCGWLALRATFGRDAYLSGATVRFWGFRAPFGAWVCIWGAFAMVTSAPFDDWWHNTYGLDVKILSPPHVLLALGIAAIQCGAMLMALAWQNRSVASRARLGQLFLFGAGLLLILVAVLGSEYLERWRMHQSLFYEVSAGAFPFLLVSAGRASIARWPATITALVYTGVMWVMLIVLPMFHGQPLLGPIYAHIDRFMPPDFPLLLFVPALCVDLAMRRVRGHDWRLSLLVGIVFVAAFLAGQWPFADFLMSPWARNWVFATHRLPYQVDLAFQQRWFVLEPADTLRIGIPIAVLLACVSTRLGLWWGNWMSRVQR
jgi:hypothetical protein